MLVQVSANTAKPAPSQLSELARQDAFWSELKIRGGSKLFGEAEPADYIYQIREGAVRTYKQLSDGRRQIGAFHLAGDVLAVENCATHRFSAEAIVDTTVWFAKRRRLFTSFAKGNIRAANNVRHLITRTLEHAENHLLLLGRQNSLEKVAAFLLEMDHRLEHPNVMALPMSRRDIADYLGMTLETVSARPKTHRRASASKQPLACHCHRMTKQECCAKKCPGAWGAAGAVTWGSCAAGPAARDGLCLKIRCCRTVLANTVNSWTGPAAMRPPSRASR